MGSPIVLPSHTLQLHLPANPHKINENSYTIKVGITGTDDANVAVRDGSAVKIVYPDESGMGMDRRRTRKLWEKSGDFSKTAAYWNGISRPGALASHDGI